jgi:hypothetical protein
MAADSLLSERGRCFKFQVSSFKRLGEPRHDEDALAVSADQESLVRAEEVPSFMFQGVLTWAGKGQGLEPRPSQSP